jgi:hypothetical protein
MGQIIANGQQQFGQQGVIPTSGPWAGLAPGQLSAGWSRLNPINQQLEQLGTIGNQGSPANQWINSLSPQGLSNYMDSGANIYSPMSGSPWAPGGGQPSAGAGAGAPAAAAPAASSTVAPGQTFNQWAANNPGMAGTPLAMPVTPNPGQFTGPGTGWTQAQFDQIMAAQQAQAQTGGGGPSAAAQNAYNQAMGLMTPGPTTPSPVPGNTATTNPPPAAAQQTPASQQTAQGMQPQQQGAQGQAQQQAAQAMQQPQGQAAWQMPPQFQQLAQQIFGGQGPWSQIFGQGQGGGSGWPWSQQPPAWAANQMQQPQQSFSMGQPQGVNQMSPQGQPLNMPGANPQGGF